MNIITAAGTGLGPALTEGAAELATQVGVVVPIAAVAGAGIIAIGVGWRLFKRFVRG